MKIIRLMGPTPASLLTVILLVASLCTHAQNFPENRITLSFTNDSLHRVLRAIGDTQPDRHLNFSYFVNHMKQSAPVTVKLDNVTLTEALTQVLENQPTYKGFQIIEYGSFRMVQLTQQPVNNLYFNKNRIVDSIYHIGDELPNIPLKIENFHTSPVLMDDFKGKLLILDMWGVNCGGCIAAFPKMEALQEKFGDKIQIILATKDSKAMVDELKTRSKLVSQTNLPIVTGESPLAYLFDYRGVPIQFWIDETGRLKYVTRHTSEDLIADYFAGLPLNLSEKRDTSFHVGYDRPIGVGLNTIHGANFGVSSYLAPHDNSVYEYALTVGNGHSLDDSARIKSYKRSAISLHSMYKFAFGKTESVTKSTYDQTYFPNSRVIVDASDRSKFIPSYGPTKKNLYDFELIVKNKKLTLKEFRALVRHQLDAYFGFESYLESREIPCYVIKKKGKTNSLLTKGLRTSHDLNEVTLSLSSENMPWWYLLSTINMERTDRLPLFDETGIDLKTLVDIDISIKFDDDLNGVNKSLSPYGLVVEKTTRNKEVIVLKERH